MAWAEPVEDVGPNALVGKVLRQYWHPVSTSADLEPGKAKPLRVLGEEFTIYRGAGGRVHILGPRCAHRYTWLHTGRVQGDEISCFYHGWRYDGTGQCTLQPAEAAGLAEKVRIPGYPAEEYAGLVFGYFGEGSPPLLPHYPQLDDPSSSVVAWIRPPGVWPVNFFQIMENSCDPVHGSFSHFGSVPAWRAIPEISVEDTAYGMRITALRPGQKERVTRFYFPNLIYTEPIETGGTEGDEQISTATKSHSFAWHVPIDNENSLYFGSVAMTSPDEAFLSDPSELTESDLSEIMLAERPPVGMVEEDWVAVVGQGALADRSNERLGRSDVAVARLRRMWRNAITELSPRAPGTPNPSRVEIRPNI
jgi:5,5'-dehydrodivanillate O-demethylase oxygenase subunit